MQARSGCYAAAKDYPRFRVFRAFRCWSTLKKQQKRQLALPLRGCKAASLPLLPYRFPTASPLPPYRFAALMPNVIDSYMARNSS